MNWQDTVMNIKQVRKVYDGVELKPVCEAQAEISFKLGCKEGIKKQKEKQKDEAD